MPRGRPKKKAPKVILVKPVKASRQWKKYINAGDGISLKQAMPQSMTRTLRYCQKGSIDSGGTISLNTFRANGAYDPYATGGGHQPMGFDQYATLYNRYLVKASKFRAWFWSEDAATSYMAVCGCFVTDDTTITASAGDMTVLVEQGLSNWKLIRCSPDHPRGFGDVKGYFNAKKVFKLKDLSDNQDNIGAPVDNNPSQEAIFCLWVASPDGMTNLPAMQYICEIEYTMTFTDPKELVQS